MSVVAVPPPRKIRIFFLAWGYSIHAYRRIKIFADDERFDVALASTFAYDIPGVTLVPLLTAKNFVTPAQASVEPNAQQPKPSRKARLYSMYQWLQKGVLKIHLMDTLTARLPEDLSIAWRDVQTLKKAVKNFSPDVIFLQTLLYPTYLAFFLPKSLPLMITFWNGDVLWWAKWNGIDRWLKKRIVTTGVRRATAITVNSQMAVDACLNYGASPNVIHLLRYPGVNHQLFFPRSKEEARKRLNITHRHVVLWPRGLGGYLNSDVFIQAAMKFLKLQPDVLFILLSKVGAEHAELYQQQIAEEGLTENFRWSAQVSFADMPWYHSAADVMVSLSANDSLPNVMLEAMACGTPLIMSDIQQIREWITSGENGYLVTPTDVEQVFQTLRKIYDPQHSTLIQKFIQSNISLVKQLADQQTNERIIKQLVIDVANRHSPTHRSL